jgi:VWFA-related protein
MPAVTRPAGSLRRAPRVRRLLIGAAVTLAAGAAAQSPSQTPTFRSRADLVQVDVVVVDADGQPVRGLDASAFALTDRRQPQVIATFEEIDRTAADAASAEVPGSRADVATNQTEQSARLVVLVVDDLHLFRGRTDRAKAIARSVLREIGPQASMAILFTSGSHSTLVTTNRARLLAAVDTLQGRKAWRRPHHAQDQQKVAHGDPEAALDTRLGQIQRAQDANLQEFMDNQRQYRTLEDAARLLVGNQSRRKAFIMVSEGIGKDLSGLFGAMALRGDTPLGGTEYAAGDVAATMEVQPTSYHDMALLRMMEQLRRANVATYAIDPRGAVDARALAVECVPSPGYPDPCLGDGTGGPADWVSWVRQAQHGLEIMAAASGGFAVTNTDDFDAGLARIVSDLDHYYLLGFYPSNPDGKGYRPLAVRLPGHPAWTLRYRRGYHPEAGASRARESDPLVRLSAGVLPARDLPLRLQAVPFAGRGKQARVALALEVTAPAAALRDDDGRLRDTLEYEVLVIDERNARVRSLAGLEAHVTFAAIEPGRPAPAELSYQVSDRVELPPGRYQLRVSATSARLARGGSVYLDIDVPDFAATPLAMSGLLVGYADGARLPVARAAARAGGGGAAVASLRFPPSLDRTFTQADVLRVYFEVHGRSGVRQATVDVIDAGGHLVASAAPSAEGGWVDVAIPLATLVPGSYSLRAAVTDGRQVASQQIGFVIH